MHADELGFLGLFELLSLILGGPAASSVRLQLLRLARFERALNRGNDADIQHSFFPIGLGMLVVDDAIREVFQLTTKLIRWREALVRFLLANRYRVLETSGHCEGRR